MSDAPVLEQQQPATAVTQQSFADLYPYGWRDQLETLPNGARRWIRIPLTLEDVLHPHEDDILSPTDEHERYRNYLYNVMHALVEHDPTAVVLSDTNVAWDVAEIKPHRPDIAVIFNIRERRNWGTFDVVAEGTRPALIIEITSPKTRHVDLEDKYEEYELVRLPLYVIIDILQRKRGVTRELKGYQLTPDGYVTLRPNEQGWLWLAPVSAWLAVSEGTIVCYDREGNRIESYVALARARRQAEARAADEARARAAAEARAIDEAPARAAAEARAAELEELLRQQTAKRARHRNKGEK